MQNRSIKELYRELNPRECIIYAGSSLSVHISDLPEYEYELVNNVLKIYLQFLVEGDSQINISLQLSLYGGSSMNLYISDLHFGHSAVINFEPRPFLDVDEMDNILIELWNSRVTKNDQVYILGDFAFRNEKPYSWYLRQLKGQKHLIVGNHDKKLLKDSAAMSYFVSVDHYREITDNQKRLVLSHYPIAEWDNFHHGAYHIYGHIHNKTEGAYQYMKQFDTALNAAACINNYTPSSLNELIRNNQVFRKK